jgi:hypothetical protein
MATEPERDTSRTVVKTYVPAYQREEWDEHADDLDMSRSEFVRSMVQAGKRGFGEWSKSIDQEESGDKMGSLEDTEESQDRELEELVLETLSEAKYLSWEQLLAAVTDDIESRLEETLQSLQDDNKVRYSGRNGGYTRER